MRNLVGLRPADTPKAVRFTRSALAAEGAAGPVEAFWDWFAERDKHQSYEVERIPLDDMRGWRHDAETGNLTHDSGRFFSVEGLHVRIERNTVRQEWRQPILIQPEIGILGLLAREIDGVLHFLVQAKTEPGNRNKLQISPTVQATRSNYMRVHHGASTRYLEYFTEYRGRVLVDVLQSEHGAYFLQKRNRNIIIETDEDVPVHEDFRWLTLRQLKELMPHDDLINMNTRTVLSCVPYAADSRRRDTHGDPFGASLAGSLDTSRSFRPLDQVLSWFTDVKTRYELSASPVPLREALGDVHPSHAIPHGGYMPFDVIGVAARIDNREVASWRQPILRPRETGLFGFVVRRIDGVPHVLLRAVVEPGMRDIAELAPSVQSDRPPVPGSDEPPPFLDYVSNAPPGRIRYDTILSEEGGRFYHARNRYVIVEADEDFPVDVPPDFQWLTLDQIMTLVRHSYYFTIQARTLIACLHSLW